MLNPESLISSRARSIDASGIRRVFELAATMKDPINLSIGQPDFDVPDPIKNAAIEAIRAGRNGYTLTQGIASLRETLGDHLQRELGWGAPSKQHGLLVTSGTCGGLILAYLALAEPGDEVVMPDPYFVVYPHAAAIAGATPVYCDTRPDFRLTAARLEPILTRRTKFVILNSPANPTGVVLTDRELHDIVDLCNSLGVLIVSDEIYDRFTYPDGLGPDGRYATPARFTDQILVLRGFSKTYGMTGWRLGYAAGPKPIIDEMAKLQQHSFVCAPSMVQYAGVAALNVDMSSFVAAYARKRDLVVDALSPVTELVRPCGAFYAFPRIPQHLGLTATEFAVRAASKNVLAIPGNVFSRQDTHLRISYAVSDDRLKRGLDILRSMMHRA